MVAGLQLHVVGVEIVPYSVTTGDVSSVLNVDDEADGAQNGVLQCSAVD
jgi:hypothetical protein